MGNMGGMGSMGNMNTMGGFSGELFKTIWSNDIEGKNCDITGMSI
jgi:hypothetical protein